MASVLVKSLNRLSRSDLIGLALTWLQEHHGCRPYLAANRTLSESEEEDYLYTPAENVDALRQVYELLKEDAEGSTKLDVVDRIIDGDWRRGLSLHQLAMIDFAYLEQNDTALRWSALRLVPRQDADDPGDGSSAPPASKRRRLHHSTASYPHLSPTAFVTALKSEIAPLVKAHYYLHRLPAPYNLSILRLYISPKSSFAPNQSSIPRSVREATDVGRVMYIALPDSCPYLYISLSGSASSNKRHGAKDSKGRIAAKVDMAAMRRIILEAIPKALSRPQQRWALESTNLTVQSLQSICKLKGNEKPGTSGGAYEVFGREDQDAFDNSPVEMQLQERCEKEEVEKMVIERFGSMEGRSHAALDRMHVKIEDVTGTTSRKRRKRAEDFAQISLTFGGSDVFLGLKSLAKLGSDYAELGQTPPWITGELNVSSVTV